MNRTDVTLTPRGDIAFLFAEQKVLFAPTLDGITALEQSCGSLWQLVDTIEQNRLPCCDLVQTYTVLLQSMDEEEVLAEIVQKGAAHYLLVLLQICIPILTGLENMGAIGEKDLGEKIEGKTKPQCAGL